MDHELIIVGGGILGSALAYTLAEQGMTDVLVVDVDLEGELSSTERNAGGVRHLWQNPINIELARHSIAFFRSIKKEIGFQETGYLWLYKDSEVKLAEQVLRSTEKEKLHYEFWDKAQITAHSPHLDKLDHVGCAMFGAMDGLINSNALKLYLREKAQQKGVSFQSHHWVEGIEESESGVTLRCQKLPSSVNRQDFLRMPVDHGGKEKLTAKRVVLTTGAWTDFLYKSMGKKSPLRPIRRQIALFKAENLNLNAFGMTVDSSRVYFHPEGGQILAGLVLKDEKPGYRFDLDADFFETHIWPALYERSSHFEALKFVTGWGGLYSYTPDTTGILGQLLGSKRIFECHSFTGRGVMQSYGAAVAMSELLTQGKFLTLDASCLHASRFDDPSKLLYENLHI